MKLLPLVFLALGGCALAPDGSEAGFWFRIGTDANQSFAYQWGNLPRDPTWRCPGPDESPTGIPSWIERYCTADTVKVKATEP